MPLCSFLETDDAIPRSFAIGLGPVPFVLIGELVPFYVSAVGRYVKSPWLIPRRLPPLRPRWHFPSTGSPTSSSVSHFYLLAIGFQLQIHLYQADEEAKGPFSSTLQLSLAYASSYSQGCIDNSGVQGLRIIMSKILSTKIPSASSLR